MEMNFKPDALAFAKELYCASQAERISLIRARVPASHILELAEAMSLSRKRLLSMLNLPDT